MMIEKTKDEIEEFMKKSKRAVIGIGAIEQHGPMAVGCDTIIVDYISKLVGEAVNALVLPAIPYGFSEMFMEYPGTISISQEAIGLLFSDIFASLKKQGFEEIIVLNSHDPNVASIRGACFKAEELGLKVILIDIWNFSEIKKIISSEIYHACEDEGSVLFFINEKLVKGKTKEIPFEMKMNYFVFPMPEKYRSRSGVYGDLNSISKAKGKAIKDEVINGIVEIVNREWNKGD